MGEFYYSGKSPAYAAIKGVIIIFLASLSVAIFFRAEILGGFNFLSSDRFDGIIENSILEHWKNFFYGASAWNSPLYFYNVSDVLGYNDGYFLYGCVYTVWRFLGFDAFIANDMTSIVFRFVGFFSFYFMMRKVFIVSFGWALLGAFIFTLNHAIFLHAGHQQFHIIGLLPLLATFLYEALFSFFHNKKNYFIGYGLAFSVLLSACLITAYYMTWYFLFFSVVFFVVLIIRDVQGNLNKTFFAIRKNLKETVIVSGFLLISLIPFLAVYLPKLRESGAHSYAEALVFAPSLYDVLDVGRDNFIYGKIVERLSDGGKYFNIPESSMGIPYTLACIFMLSCFWFSFRKNGETTSSLQNILATNVSIVVLITSLLSVKFGEVSGYWLVYKLIPGAKGVRVVARYFMFLEFPVIAVSIYFLSYWMRRFRERGQGVGLFICLAVLLVLEQIGNNPSQFLALNVKENTALYGSVPKPPEGCEAFYVSRPRSGEKGTGGDPIAVYSHNVDAMFIAERINLPTLNGLATFFPKGWNLTNPGDPDYLERVHSFAYINNVASLCALDLTEMTWNKDVSYQGPAEGQKFSVTTSQVPYSKEDFGKLSLVYQGRTLRGGIWVVNLLLKNAGNMPIAADSATNNAVHISWRSVDSKGAPLSGWDKRRPLPFDVPAHGQLPVTLYIAPGEVPEGGRLQVSFVQERLFWAHDIGVAPLSIEWGGGE